MDDSGGKMFMSRSEWVFEETSQAFSTALWRTVEIGQVWFNRRSGTFTGEFRIAAVGSALIGGIATLYLIRDAFGPSPNVNSSLDLGIETVLDFIAPIWLAYQALTLKGVPQVEPEEDEDE